MDQIWFTSLLKPIVIELIFLVVKNDDFLIEMEMHFRPILNSNNVFKIFIQTCTLRRVMYTFCDMLLTC